MSTRAQTARHVRQRKLNTKQALRIIRENEIDEQPDDESQRHIPQVETGVEKGEEIEYHLQAAINAANAATLGAKTKQNYIPTPDATRAKNIDYDSLYPKKFSQPQTHIRFSSTVEDCIGVPYCMNDDDVEFLAKLNEGKDVDGRDRRDKLSQCSEDTFEEVMNFFEETSTPMQPFANVDHAPFLSLEEMEQSIDDSVCEEAQRWLRPIYQYWILRKGSRPLMPSIKVRVLDTTSEADDADPYVCFRRREVRQTRKTRGRDAQVVEKLKKLRTELEQARLLVQMVRDREQSKKENLEVSRKVFEQRAQLKEVKITKNIIGEKGDDEELLVNQKPVQNKPKVRTDLLQQRPSTLRLGSGQRAGPDNDLYQLSDYWAGAEDHVITTIENRKEQHKKWNQKWIDATWRPITPPPDTPDDVSWTPIIPEGVQLLSPPPSLPSEFSYDKDGDVAMADTPPMDVVEKDTAAGADPEPDIIFHIPGMWPSSEAEEESATSPLPTRDRNPFCRIRRGRGGRRWLESRKTIQRSYARALNHVVVSDEDSDEDESPAYFPVKESMGFEYRVALNRSARPEGVGVEQQQQRKHWSSGDQTAMAGAATGAHGHLPAGSSS